LFHAPAAPRLYPLSLPDALPILTGAEPTCSAVTDETAPVSSRRCAVPYPIATTSSSWVAWGVNAKSSAASWSGSTVTGFVTAVYPMRFTLIVCSPTGTSVMRYRPSSPDRALSPVPTTVMVATAIPCPLRESVTRPVTVPPWNPSSEPRLTSAACPRDVNSTSTPASYNTALNTAPTVRLDALNVTRVSSGTTAAL